LSAANKSAPVSGCRHESRRERERGREREREERREERRGEKEVGRRRRESTHACAHRSMQEEHRHVIEADSKWILLQRWDKYIWAGGREIRLWCET
jgi:hypothetical protein